MGLLKETMHAIIHISENLAIIRKAMTRDDSWYRANYQQEAIEQVRSRLKQSVADGCNSLLDQLPQLDEFPYPEHLTFGGRLKAVRVFKGLNQTELSADIGISSAHVSKLESDLSAPSAMLIRSVSVRYGINEQWLTTGHLPQTTKEPAKPVAMSMVTPLSGYEHEEDIPPEIMIDFGRDRELLPVQRSPLVDKNISKENV